MQWLIDMAKEAMQDVLDDYSCFTPRTVETLPAIILDDLVQDNTWCTADIAAFVPADANVVLISVAVSSYSSGQLVYIDRVYNNNAHTFYRLEAVETLASYYAQLLVDISVAKYIRYKISAGGLAICNFEILGTFK